MYGGLYIQYKLCRVNFVNDSLQNVTESVFYVTLNHSTPEVARLLEHRVVQRCERVNEETPFKCTPHYDTQPNASEF